MTVLTFFIIISMTLRGQQLANVTLPEADRADNAEAAADVTEQETLVVGLNAAGEILLENQPASVEQLTQQMQDFLGENPTGVVLLKADRGLTFSEVNNLLKTMRDIGGQQVSLAFDRESSEE
ncbi:MAG: hypothetical protein Kow00121_43860 [Elainellaceae cyanobacterium]